MTTVSGLNIFFDGQVSMEISYFPKLFQILELDGERRKFKVAVLTESFCRLLLPYSGHLTNCTGIVHGSSGPLILVPFQEQMELFFRHPHILQIKKHHPRFSANFNFIDYHCLSVQTFVKSGVGIKGRNPRD